MFLSRRAEEPSATPPQGDVDSALREVERLLAEQQRATEALRTRLAELEQPG